MHTKGEFRFENEELFLTWSALQYGDKSLAIGYKPARLGDIRPIMHDINIRTGEWKAVHDALIEYIVDTYKQ